MADFRRYGFGGVAPKPYSMKESTTGLESVVKDRDLGYWFTPAARQPPACGPASWPDRGPGRPCLRRVAAADAEENPDQCAGKE